MPLRTPLSLLLLAPVCALASGAAAAQPDPVFRLLAEACLEGDPISCEDAERWAPDEGLALWIVLEQERLLRQRSDLSGAEEQARDRRHRTDRLAWECDWSPAGAECGQARAARSMACLYGHADACWAWVSTPGLEPEPAAAVRSLTRTLEAAEAGSAEAWAVAPAPVTSARERRQALRATGGGGWSTSWDFLEMEQQLVEAVAGCDRTGDPAACLELARTVNGPAGALPPPRIAQLAGEMCALDPRSSACVVRDDLSAPASPVDSALWPAAAVMRSLCDEAEIPRACALEARLLDQARITVTGSAASRDARRRACEGGHRPSCLELEEIYRDGVAAALDRACDGERGLGGEMAACHELALAQRSGAGLLRNPHQAEGRLRWACDHGYAPSCEALPGFAPSGAPSRGLEEDCRRGDHEACLMLARRERAEGPGTAPYAGALLLGLCRAGSHAGCVELAWQLEGDEAPRPAGVSHARHLFQRACVAGSAPACDELERLGPGPAEPPPFPGPEVVPLPPLPPVEPPVEPPPDPDPIPDPRPRPPRPPPPMRDVGGLGFHLAAGTLRSWSADTQASVLRTGTELVWSGLGFGSELEHVSDYRFRPKEGRTYQRYTLWGYGLARLPLTPHAHLTFGAGVGLGSFRPGQDTPVFSGAVREFLAFDVVVWEMVRFAVRVEQRQYHQLLETFDTDHATGVFMTVGLYGDP